ncbi:MAG: PHB depolymerase family esterase [Pseudomonadota bacterium]|nr:PHB depolymerase family esterase [Pseudomonadota bacterium]
MRRLGSTVARLHALRRASMAATGEAPGRLTEVSGFGTNPGALVARCHIPDHLAPGAPLVVVLHGCTQNAALYDRGSGWSKLADRHGFAVLFPEQTRANNANLCFNWYSQGDARRGRGEAASIAQMVRHLIARHDLDPAQTFINGLSAGGAMTAVMLACYPEMFAGGAIIAGLPFGVAEGVPEALERMRGQGMPSRAALASRIANAADHDGPWPTLSVWHGTADFTVSIANAGAIVDQWRDRIGLGEAEGQTGTVDGQHRTIWRDPAGRVMIERYDIAGMGHGTPLGDSDEGRCGQPGAHMLEVGICSTRRLAAFWGLAKTAAARSVAPVGASPKPAPAIKLARRRRVAAPAKGVGAVIEDALRAAGLMR